MRRADDTDFTAFVAASSRRLLRGAYLITGDMAAAVLVLRYFHDLTEAETARVLGCSVGTVKSQHARAMARLRQLLPDRRST